eukprot:COSAG06_NODE_5623_length_3353_cov_5.747388_1_plen_175_part_00
MLCPTGEAYACAAGGGRSSRHPAAGCAAPAALPAGAVRHPRGITQTLDRGKKTKSRGMGARVRRRRWRVLYFQKAIDREVVKLYRLPWCVQGQTDTGHKALCPVSRYVDRAYLWAPALGTGHTCVSRRSGIPWARCSCMGIPTRSRSRFCPCAEVFGSGFRPKGIRFSSSVSWK